jgi:hypothetical protein
LVVARVDRAHTANARARGDVFAFASIDVKRAPEGATSPKGPLARRWARLKLDELIAANDRNSIAAHALRYGLVSPMTSMIAIGDEVVVSGGVKHTVPVPVSLPAGMRWQTVKRELAVDANAGGTVTLEAKSEPQPPADKKVPVAKLPERNGHEAPAQPKPAKKASEREERKHKDDDGDDDEDGRKVSRHRVQDAPRATTAAGPHAPPAPVAAHEAPPPVAAQGSTAPATGEDARAPMAPPEAESKTATIDGDAAGAAEATMVDEVMASAPSSGSHRRLRFSLGLGAAAEHGASDLVVANRLSYEVGGRLRLGAEGALWFVDGAHAQGTLLATFARLSLIPHLDLIGGFGLHLGGGAGPAGALGLRWRLKPHLSAFLRYDGALLFHDSTRDGQNTGTLGVETSF